MRLALISYHTSPLAPLGSSSAGGMNVYVRRLAEGLAERGVEVDVFTRRDNIDGSKELEFTPGARLIQVRAGPPRVISKAELAAHTPSFAESVARYVSCRDLHYDVIHSHYWLSGLAAQALRSGDQTLVHMFHTLSRVKRLYQPDAGSSDAASRDYAELTLLKSGHTLVFSTESEVEDVERIYGFRPSSVAFIPPGVDPERFAPGKSEQARRLLGLEGGPLILFVGRMDRAKGVDLLLEALSILRSSERWKALRLAVVGGDDNRRDAVARAELGRLHSIVQELGLAEAVLFQGVVPQEKLPAFYAASDVCAVPSRYESFGMVALEALSSGRPVVGFESRGLEQTVRHGRTGMLVPAGDVEGLAGALASVLSDRGLSHRMGMAARESVKKFTWDRVADESVNLYGRLMDDAQEGFALRSS